MTHPTYRTADVDGFEVFYREAGDRSKPTLLLHGFPTPAICVGHWNKCQNRGGDCLFKRYGVW